MLVSLGTVRGDEPPCRRVEKTSTGSEEHQHVDRQGEAKAESNIEQSCRIGMQHGGLVCEWISIDDLNSTNGEEQKYKCANEFFHHRNKMSSDHL